MSERVDWLCSEKIKFRTESRYDPAQPIVCNYRLSPLYVVHSRDYIALYYASESLQTSKGLSNYLTFQWADATSDKDNRTVTFFARHLPQPSRTLLCFAYISWCDGVLGTSDNFEIWHCCGDPVPIVSYTTEQSSFLVIDKSHSDATSPDKPISYEFEHRRSGDKHANQSNVSEAQVLCEVINAVNHPEEQKVSTGNDQVEDSGKTFNYDSAEVLAQNEIPNLRDDDTVESSSRMRVQALASTNSRNESSQDEVEENQCKDEMEHSADVSSNQSTRQSTVSVTRTREETVPRRMQLVQEMVACDEANARTEQIQRHQDTMQQQVSQLEGEIGANVVQTALMQRSLDSTTSSQASNEDESKMNKLMEKNRHLHSKVDCLETQLRSNDKTISLAKEKLRAAKSRIRDLEHALITERLSYENKLRELTNKRGVGTSNSGIEQTRLEDNDQKADEEYYTALPGVVVNGSEVCNRPVTGSHRALSALVRLGIEDEEEPSELRIETTPQTHRGTQKSSASNEIACPMCGVSSSSFTDQTAFAAHVNEHFSD